MNKTNFLNMAFVGLQLFGTLVGAGFASGKEIWVYFARFGNFSFVSVILVCVLFFFSCFLFFSFGKNFSISSVQQCTNLAFGKGALVCELLLVLSNLVLLSSMFAGADSLFEIVVPNFPYHLAGVVSAIITLVVVCFGFRGITKTNVFIVPLLILMIVCVLIASSAHGNTLTFFSGFNSQKTGMGLLYGLLFLGSNMFFSGFVFARMGKEFKKCEILGGTILGCFLLLVALVLVLVLLFSHPTAITSNMPVVEIALSLNLWLAIFSLVVIWLGLITTAFALLYTISNWLKTYFGNPVLMTALASVVSLLLSGLGFNLFVKYIYPFMGIFGFVFMFFVLLAKIRAKNSQKNHFSVHKTLKTKK